VLAEPQRGAAGLVYVGDASESVSASRAVWYEDDQDGYSAFGCMKHSPDLFSATTAAAICIHACAEFANAVSFKCWKAHTAADVLLLLLLLLHIIGLKVMPLVCKQKAFTLAT
jgi:hypothetical protein